MPISLEKLAHKLGHFSNKLKKSSIFIKKRDPLSIYFKTNFSIAINIRYFVFTSFWAYKIYYVYGFMLLVFLILIVVTICVTIVTTYFLLNAEDYRWQWTSFTTGASIALYIYMYSFYYYFFKTK